ncbi:hypothetical protein L6164_037605 [Bauhinia variegata]|uniref:Uncharacterized protein n=1 Tax=Bauhinia variegata TaxID=167791 RepID=A0ACB9KKQ2_BAUVA|nr:hypothetical protein L6164_037605 [Bauhinia variegata]
MESRTALCLALMLWCVTIEVHCEYYTTMNSHSFYLQEKVTNLNFYIFDILSGARPSAVEVAHANVNFTSPSATPFGSLYAIDDVLREGPTTDSKVIGNAKGMYLSASQLNDKLTLVMYIDLGFTTGEFNGSSLSVFSRNPVTEPEREMAVVGGRGKFRMARGFVQVRTYYLNTTNGDAILHYNITAVHY